MALAEKVAQKQKVDFKTGNEMAALSAAQINFHVMGYYPITPSTEVAEFLDQMKAEDASIHDIKLVAADGEHGAAGICYGASTGGGRVINATSANGYLYALEQMPVQSGTRFPMVLDLVTRCVSGPLNIRGDHSDLYFALNTGWIILLARDPQAVYDMNIIATKLGEHPDVRLPVIVAYDGFFTSHQKRRVEYFDDNQVVRDFVGQMPEGFPDVLDPRNPISVGSYMNDPDVINNRYQMHLAMEHAARVYDELTREWAAISGRNYAAVDCYEMEDAEVAVFLLNSAAETAKEVADHYRAAGKKVGVISPNIIRPFPAQQIREALKGVKAVVIGDRADSYGAGGGNMGLEVKAALKDDPATAMIPVANRVYGLGGLDFFPQDAEQFFDLALELAAAQKHEANFDYYGTTADTGKSVVQVLRAFTPEELAEPLTKVTVEEDGSLKVTVSPPRAMTARPQRIAPGHGACPGCGIFGALDGFFKALEGDVVVLYHTGCAMVVSTGYPYSAHRVSYIHNLFQNGAATLSGAVEMFWERKRRGEIEVGDDPTFVMVSGDGGMDIGMGPAIGAALRNHKMIILEYDNEGYMNTGSQLSYSTPMGHRTSTSNIGPDGHGKAFHHKDTVQIMAATHIPYVFTAVESSPQDLWRKAAKAQWYAKNVGLAYGKILIACPLNWIAPDHLGTKIVQAAVDSCFFPLLEIEQGITKLTYNPEDRKKRIPLTDWLSMMGKTRHLTRPENAEILASFEAEVERRWKRIKAMHEHPDL